MSSVDWFITGAQFTIPFFEGEIENFPKYSALHAFCDFEVCQLMFEDAEEQLREIQVKYDELDVNNKAQRLRIAFEYEGRDDCFLEVDRLFKMYGIKHETFFSYLVNNDFEFIIDVYDDFTAFDGELDDMITHLSRELFYILFQN